MNMKSFLRSVFCAVAFFMSVGAKGQDKIITTHNDTVECRIVSISSTHINYEQTTDGYTVGKFIPISEVVEYNMGTAKPVAKKANKTVPIQYVPPKRASLKPWQMGTQFGGSYLTASTADAENALSYFGVQSDESRAYYKKLKHGIHLGVTVRRLFEAIDGDMNMGMGLKYRLSFFSSHLDVMVPQGYHLYYKFAETENIYLHYWGLSYFVQQWLDKGHKFKITSEISGGFVYLRDEVRFDNPVIIDNMLATGNTLSTGKTLGTDGELFFSYYPLDYLSINIGGGYFISKFREFTISTGNQVKTLSVGGDKAENYSHLHYSIGIQFHF
jgi:hypothetical protein